MSAYYNEIDPFAAQWLRNLISAGHIASGEIDDRSIIDVRADDLRGFTQCHFFAGIGVWSHALRLAGWPDEEEIWTGSCPCQPFSDAGAGEAFDDERDLWPVWFQLVRERRPVAIAGEQVASRLGLAWLDALHADLEGEAYTVGAVDTCSAGFGSPNIRQRLYWVAHADEGRGGRHAGAVLGAEGSAQREMRRVADGSESGRQDVRLGEPSREGLEGYGRHGDDRDQPGRIGTIEVGSVAEAGELGWMADPDGERGERWRRNEGGERDERLEQRAKSDRRSDTGEGLPGPLNGFWRSADWLCCTDGKWRPVRPGSFPLVTGAPGRLGRLRAYGNAINAQVAAQFIQAYMSVQP